MLWSVIIYYITLGVLLGTGVSNKFDINIESFKIIIDALEYAMTMFGSYAFGTKFISVYRAKKQLPEDDTEPGININEDLSGGDE